MIQKRVFKKFPTLKYREKTNKLFYKKMISKGHLYGDKKDIFILELIEDEMINNQLIEKTKYSLQSLFEKSFSILTLLFGIYATLIVTNSKDFIFNNKLVLAYSVLFFAAIFIVIYVDTLILDNLNSKYRKQKHFLRSIKSLKNTLKLKYN